LGNFVLKRKDPVEMESVRDELEERKSYQKRYKEPYERHDRDNKKLITRLWSIKQDATLSAAAFVFDYQRYFLLFTRRLILDYHENYYVSDGLEKLVELVPDITGMYSPIS
jgi:hypothetical protein